MTRRGTSLLIATLATTPIVLTACSARMPTPSLPYMPQYLALRSTAAPLELPDALPLSHGACTLDGRNTVAMAAGPACLLLVDLTGPNNRCELLLWHNGRPLLYERVGQRPPATASARSVTAPFAVSVSPGPLADQMTARIALYLQRSERVALDPFAERSPRRLYLRGTLRLARRSTDDPVGQFVIRTATLITDQPDALRTNAIGTLPAFRQVPIPPIPLPVATGPSGAF